jgi:purine nucleosidase
LPVQDRRRIILDCDPGHDDAVAMLLALASPELEVLGITTTYGNVALERTTDNALKIRDLAASQVPVYEGADRPLVRNRISAEYVHGNTGLNGPPLPAAKAGPAVGRAVDFIIDSVLTHPGEVTIVPVGPLTNLALALRLEPRIAPAIREIVIMGGSTDVGNTTPSAEFNILCDPHAARIVFECGAPIVMFGLNLTHQALSTPDRVARFRNLGSRVGTVTADLLDFFQEHHLRRYGWIGAPLHDPCTIAYLLRPELFKTRAMNVEIDATDGPSFGRTVCDLWSVTGKAENALVALEVDADGFFDLLTERIGTYR